MARRNIIRVLGVPGIPLIDEDCDLVQAILSAISTSGIQLIDGDILVLAQTVISKSEGRVVHKDSVEVSPRAKEIADVNGFDPVHVELALRESRKVLRTDGVLITENLNGLVCNFSGVDRSNAPEGYFVLLPEDPDNSARRILEEMESRTGLALAVVITDTQGRPWRKGSINIAIGCAGINAFKHNRGLEDLYGRIMQRSTVCQVDEIASAVEPIMGQGAEGIPLVIIRGYDYETGPERGSDIPRPEDEDLFR
ncbi:MAG: coenzyme F420-0:L-glutamate ligase [Candidatus Thorarchaeota archaeon]|nr:MAG: coenzyme F420-0:L-glutamate ligase [Candidatus Thorarchaeota archaeon]